MQPSLSQRIMKMNHAFGLRENKPNQSQSQNRKQKLARHQCGGTENRSLPAISVAGQKTEDRRQQNQGLKSKCAKAKLLLCSTLILLVADGWASKASPFGPRLPLDGDVW